MDPSAVFEDTFQREPGSTVRNVRSKVFWFAHTGSTYLRFETDAATFRSLVPPDLPPVTHREFLEKRRTAAIRDRIGGRMISPRPRKSI